VFVAFYERLKFIKKTTIKLEKKYWIGLSMILIIYSVLYICTYVFDVKNGGRVPGMSEM